MSVGDRVLGAESRFFMGRVMPRDFLDSVGEYLDQAAPDRKPEMIAAIKTRADQLAEADADLAVDAAGAGAVALGSVVLAAFEALLPLFDGDERRTILLLQHIMGPVLRRPYEKMFERPTPELFEMTVHRCLWRDFFTRHGNRLVTTVMCSWDTNWMRAIDPAVTGLHAERTSLLSLGDSQCRFAVEETDDPLHGYTDALDARFVDRTDGAAE
jgi:hypothetical protein